MERLESLVLMNSSKCILATTWVHCLPLCLRWCVVQSFGWRELLYNRCCFGLGPDFLVHFGKTTRSLVIPVTLRQSRCLRTVSSCCGLFALFLNVPRYLR